MPSVDIHGAAVIAAAVINMVIGMVWYSKALFGNQWAKLTGRKLEDMGGGGKGYAIAGVGALVQAWVLVHFVVYAGSDTFMKGAATGAWLWLGLVAVTMATGYIFENRSWMLWKINVGYFLLVLLINGGLLAAWK